MFVKEDSDRKKEEKKEKEIILYNVIICGLFSMNEESIPRMKFHKGKIIKSISENDGKMLNWMFSK